MLDQSIQDLESRSLARINNRHLRRKRTGGGPRGLARAPKGRWRSSARNGQARAGRPRAHRQAASIAPGRIWNKRSKPASRPSPKPPCEPASTPNGSTLRCPAPGPRRATCTPSPASSASSKSCSPRSVFAVLDGLSEVETIPQLRRPQHPARPSGARYAGHLLAGWRPSSAHPHVARTGPRHGASGAAAPHDRARPRVFATRAWTRLTSTPSINSKA